MAALNKSLMKSMVKDASDGKSVMYRCWYKKTQLKAIKMARQSAQKLKLEYTHPKFDHRPEPVGNVMMFESGGVLALICMSQEEDQLFSDRWSPKDLSS
jgi:hypothetical protein